MLVEQDTDAQATYVTLTDRPIVATVEVSDLVMVDVDVHGEPVGIEILTTKPLTWDLLRAVVERFPELKNELHLSLVG